MWTVVRYAIYIFIVVALFYFLKNLFSDGTNVEQSLQSSAQKITVSAQQMMHDAYENFMQKTDDEIKSVEEETKENISQIVQ